MGIFGKKAAPKKAALKEKGEVATGTNVNRNISAIIKKPRITEKAVMGIDKNVYTFEIHKDAGKHDVRAAIKELFGVNPVKIHVVTNAPRQYMSKAKGRTLSQPGLKKAYVYLKEGDRIDLV